MKIKCKVSYTTVTYNGNSIDGVEVTCPRCGCFEESGGDSIASIRRCLVLLSESCECPGNNFMVADGDGR